MKKLFFIMLNIVFSITQLKAQTTTCSDKLEPNNTKDKSTSFSGSYYRVDEVCLVENDEDWFTFPYSNTRFYIKVRGGTPKIIGRYLFKVYINGGKANIETAPSPLPNFQYTTPIDTYLELYSADGKLISWNDDDILYSSAGNKMAKIWNFDLNNYKNLVCPTPNKSDVTVVTTATTADFTWKAIDGVASFTFEWRHESVTTWNTQTVTTPKVSLTGLQPNTRYVYQIRGNCTNGLPGSNSFMTGFITQKAFTPIFTVEKRTVETIAKAGQPTVPVSSNVEWKLGNQVGNFFSLSIEKFTGGNGQDGKVIITTTENTTTADRKGSFEIQPQYAGLSAVKIDITQKGKVETTPATCAVPANLTHQVSGSTLTASWGAVTGVSYYKIDMQLNGGAWGPWGTGQTTTNQFVSSGAQSGASICYKVQAVCTNGVTSSASTPYCFKMDGGPVTTCGTPANLTHTLLTNDQATVSWDAIPGATSYDIYSNYGTATYTFLQNVTTNSITRSVSPNLNVCFKVVAVCPNAVRSPQSSEYCFDSRLLVYPNTHNVSSAAGTLTVTVDATDKWTASPSLSGVKVSPSSGNAGKNQKVTITYPALSTANKRLAADTETFKVDFNSVSTVKKLNIAVKVYQNMTPDQKLESVHKFQIDNSRESRGVKIYYRNIGTTNAEMIYVVDMLNGGQIIPKVHPLKSANTVYDEISSVNKERTVAVVNGQHFDGTTISNYLQVEGKLVVSTSPENKNKRFYQMMKFNSYSPLKATIGDFLIPSQSDFENVTTGFFVNVTCKEQLTPNGIKCFYNNSVCGNTFSECPDGITLLGGLNGSPSLGFSKVAVYVGYNTIHEAAKLLKILGVPYEYTESNKKIDVISASIVQLDGGGSSQSYGKYGNVIGWHKKSDDSRKIPQTFVILASPKSTRLGSIDSALTAVSDKNQLLEAREGITASPNPTQNGLVRLKLGGMSQEDDVEVGIFDEIGKQAGNMLSGKVMEINGREIQLPTTQTPKMFIIHALNKTTGKKYSDKVMVSGQ